MIESVQVDEPLTLDDYAAVITLSATVHALRAEARILKPLLGGRKVWMVNSTARGGGVAEMLPRLVSILRELGVPTEWVVMGTDRMEFFGLTKRLHNLIHGHGDPRLSSEDRALYEAVSRENADELKSRLGADDVLLIHDPQPLGMGALLKEEMGIPTIFRCHIGLDEDLPQTRAAWDFLKPHAETYDFSVFSTPEYIPAFLAGGHAGVIYPGIDPMSDKNRRLTTHRLVGVLCNARLAVSDHPMISEPFAEIAQRLTPEGTFVAADRAGGIGLLYRTIITQISRWDRLKGFKPLLDGFARLKARAHDPQREISDLHRRRLEIVRLVLAGPDPASIQDDPEGKEVLDELIRAYQALPAGIQEDVAIISLPMGSRKNNALMVNALHRCSTVVVQNSLREGFGLTVTEGMWKRCAVLGTRACGIRHQIRDGIDGELLQDALDSEEIAEKLDRLLADPPLRSFYGQNAQQRVHSNFLVFNQVHRWLQVLSERLRR